MHDFHRYIGYSYLSPYFDIKYGIRTNSGFRPVVDSCADCMYPVNISPSHDEQLQFIFIRAHGSLCCDIPGNPFCHIVHDHIWTSKIFWFVLAAWAMAFTLTNEENPFNDLTF